MKKTWFLDIDCPNCAAKLEAALEKLDGVTHVRVNYLQKTITLEAQDGAFEAVSAAVLKRAAELEPDAVIRPAEAALQEEPARHCACCPSRAQEKPSVHTPASGGKSRLPVRALGALVLLTAGMLLGGHPGTVFFIAAWLLSGCDVLWKAVRNILRGQLFDEHFLMSIASLGAILLGEHAEAAAVMTLYQIGEFLQDKAVEKSRRSISSLMDIRPDAATLLQDGRPVRVHPEAVEVDALILVRPGELIPLDGTVMEGVSSLDTAALTGESLPRDVAEGDVVLSGSVNLTGPLTLRVTASYGESTLSRILRLVEESSGTRANTERLITRFARIYTPLVCLAALLLAVLPSLADGQWSLWVHRALTFLVISCPCALVISVPLTFFSGIGGASRQGILMKGAQHLETLASVRQVAFDKTGTLTMGTFTVQSIHPAAEAGMDEAALLETAALAEAYSTHPVGQALRAAWGKELALQRLGQVEEVAGCGIRAQVDGRCLSVGNGRLMASEGVKTPSAREAGTVVHVAADGCYLGSILIADSLKPTAKQAIRALQEASIVRLALLTGDRQSAAESVAEALELTEVHAQLLPEDKVQVVASMLRKDAPLAFVGDGINDAPVLRRADVGVAMGALGSEAAIEAADVVLMDDDPCKLALAIRLARRTVAIARQNIFLALCVKLAVMLLGAMGLAGMWMAVFADVGVAMLCILNAVRAMRA